MHNLFLQLMKFAMDKGKIYFLRPLVMNVHIAISRDKNDIKPKNKKYFFSHVFTHIPVECWVTIWESGTISIFFCTKKKNVWEKKKINWKNIWDWKTCAMFSFIFETLWRLLFFVYIWNFYERSHKLFWRFLMLTFTLIIQAMQWDYLLQKCVIIFGFF